LSEIHEWYVDGTFAISPSLFKQVFTINVIFNGKNLPLVYAMLPDKKEITYKKMFNMLTDYISTPPTSVTSDFEMATLNAIRHCFPSSSISGCYFHFAQNLWKHMQKNSLATLYTHDKEIRVAFRAMQCLAFVPKNDVVFAFKELSKTVPAQFQCMLDYLEEFYIGKLIGKSKNNRQEPLFPIAIWNVHDRVMNDTHRTNNSLESWHKQFEADLDMKHPTINRLIEAFRIEQRNTEINYIQLTGGLACPRKTSAVEKDNRIKAVCSMYEKTKLFEFF
jgi:hypothetical protein